MVELDHKEIFKYTRSLNHTYEGQFQFKKTVKVGQKR